MTATDEAEAQDRKTAVKVVITSATLSGVALLTALLAALSPPAVARTSVSPVGAATPPTTAPTTPSAVTRSAGSGCSSATGPSAATPAPASSAAPMPPAVQPMTRSNGS